MLLGIFKRIVIWWDRLRSAYWFLPSALVAASLGVAVGVRYVDNSVPVPNAVHNVWWLYTGNAQGARELLSAIATSIMTATSVTFSITIAAFSLASQQYGPRILRGFLRDVGTQVSLGVFLAAFVYSLIVLREVRSDNVPNLSVSVAMLLAIISVAFFIFFIHHVTQAIQSESIINNVGNELEAAIRRLYPQEMGFSTQPPETDAQTFLEQLKRTPTPVVSSKFGYVTAIDDDRLVETAVHDDLVIEVVKGPGAYVERGAVLARAYSDEPLERYTADVLADTFKLGTQRSTIQDAAFAINELVEIATRALSPALNNPFTAVMVLDRLSNSLALLVQRRMPSPFRRDQTGAVRVVGQPLQFEEALGLALNPIRRYGASNPIIDASIGAMLNTLKRHAVTDRDRRLIAEQQATHIPSNSATASSALHGRPSR